MEKKKLKKGKKVYFKSAYGESGTIVSSETKIVFRDGIAHEVQAYHIDTGTAIIRILEDGVFTSKEACEKDYKERIKVVASENAE